MQDKNDFTYEDDINFEDFKFLPIIDDSFERQRDPFIPMIPSIGGDLPPIGTYPPNYDFNRPNADYDSSPNFNYPEGGVFNPPGMPKSPPPNYIPRKNDSGVQKVGLSSGVGTKAVSSNSIRFCLYKYTYIWEENGRSYWAFLLNINRSSISGFRWFRGNWVYFGLDLRRIDSFVCYRSNLDLNDKCNDCIDLNRNYNPLSLNIQKEYSSNRTRDIYTKTLASIDIPDIKEDIMTKTIGYLDENEITSEVPCVKARNIAYRITLQVTYPSDYDTDLKLKINQLTDESYNDVYKIIYSNRGNDEDYDQLKSFNSSLTLIPDALNCFSDSFNNKINDLCLSLNNTLDITYSIRNEKLSNNWKPYFYNDLLY